MHDTAGMYASPFFILFERLVSIEELQESKIFQNILKQPARIDHIIGIR